MANAFGCERRAERPLFLAGVHARWYCYICTRPERAAESIGQAIDKIAAVVGVVEEFCDAQFNRYWSSADYIRNTVEGETVHEVILYYPHFTVRLYVGPKAVTYLIQDRHLADSVVVFKTCMLTRSDDECKRLAGGGESE